MQEAFVVFLSRRNTKSKRPAAIECNTEFISQTDDDSFTHHFLLTPFFWVSLA